MTLVLLGIIYTCTFVHAVHNLWLIGCCAFNVISLFFCSILLAMSQNQSTLSKLSNEVQLLSKELNRVEEAILQAEVERERLSK